MEREEEHDAGRCEHGEAREVELREYAAEEGEVVRRFSDVFGDGDEGYGERSEGADWEIEPEAYVWLLAFGFKSLIW